MHKEISTKEEQEKVLKEIRQLENRQKILEGVFPLAPDLSGEEVKALLVSLSRLPGAEKLAAELPKSGNKP